MRIKLPQKPTFEIRCPNNLGVITLLLQGITPLQKWFPEATIRISTTQNHHYWLKKLIPTIPLSTKNQKADYIITGKIEGPWYQHRWQSLINQFKPLGLRDPSEFQFPKGTPPAEINTKKHITNDPDYAQWMALWDLPIIWSCDPKQYNPLHYGPLGVKHMLIHPNQHDLLKTTTDNDLINQCTHSNTSWSQWGLNIGVIGPHKKLMIEQLTDAGYKIYTHNNQMILNSKKINTLVFADDLMPLNWAIKLNWHNTKQKWKKQNPLYHIEATNLFEFEHQLALR